jgi:molybdopterin converting factor small subunit
MVICVNVKFLGIFQRLSGKKQLELKLQEPSTIQDVMAKLLQVLSDDFKDVLVDAQLNDPRPNALILVDGKEISALQGLETEVKDSQEIILLPMVHGG